MTNITNYGKGFVLAYRGARMWSSKHAGILFATGTVVAAGATVITGIKASREVEDILADVEQRRANGEEVGKIEVVRSVGTSVAVPVTLFAATAGMAFGGAKFMTNRVNNVAAALALANKRYNNLRQRVYDVAPKEMADEIVAPVRQTENEVETEDGQKIKVKQDTFDPDLYRFTDLGFPVSISPEMRELIENGDTVDAQIFLEKVENVLESKYLSSKHSNSGYISLADVASMFGIGDSDMPNKRYAFSNGWSRSTTNVFGLELKPFYIKRDGYVDRQYYVSFSTAAEPLYVDIDRTTIYEDYDVL